MATAKEKVELAQKHIAYQRQRIVRYKELVAKLERDNKPDLLPAARELLVDLEHALAGMMVDQARARDELEKAATDQKCFADIAAANLASDFGAKANRHT
jgi:hypothetical protein